MEDLKYLFLEFQTYYFPPSKRERVKNKLQTAEFLGQRNLTPLEIIQEKFKLESHILDKTVKVDDETERKVYSTSVFENVKRYNCNVCIVTLFGKTSLINHNMSRKHYEMMSRETHPHQNFEDHMVINLDPGMKAISMSDCYIMKDLLEACPSSLLPVLIGLEYLVEVHDPRDPYYSCLLCDKSTNDIGNLMDHLASTEHRMLYLLLFFPKVYKKLLLLKKEFRIRQLNTTVENIEKKFGRLKPWRHEGTLSLKQKKAIRHSIDSGTHFRDNPDLSFAEDIVFNEKVKNTRIMDTVITEFVVNESEESVMDVYERQKGGIYRCRLCKIIVDTPIEKITHPYTGRHLEKTVKGIAIYDRIPCEIQSFFDKFPQPLIGTEYIVEYDDQGVPGYYCMLCRKKMNNHDMVTSHLVSRAHQQLYIKHHLPKKNEELLKLSGPVRAVEIEKLLKLIDAKFGKLPAWGCLYSLDKQIDTTTTVKDLISEKIMDGKHFTIDERGMPKVIYKMPVPLFLKEGQAPAQVSEPKKKKRKKKTNRSASRCSTESSDSSRSSSLTQPLSPLAKRRGVSPEPGPSSVVPPQEPPVPYGLHKLLGFPLPGSSRPPTESFPEPYRTFFASCHLPKESIREFFARCDEDNWAERNHECTPQFSVLPLEKEVDADIFYDLRRYIYFLWLKERLVDERGWSVEDLIIENTKFATYASVLETARLCSDVCRPVCRNMVEQTVCCVLEDFPEALQMSEDELFHIIGRGLVHQSNWMHLIWASIQK